MSKAAEKNKTAKTTLDKVEATNKVDTIKNDSGKRTKTQDIESWLNLAYDFRYNTIKQKPEYKILPLAKNSTYLPLDKYKLLSIKRELDAAGFTISKDGLMDILCSSYNEAINPIKHYFRNLVEHTQTEDPILELCNTVKVKNSSHWHQYLKKWLVGVVANVFIDEKCANHTMLVLTGSQGKFKTTWLDNLCPKLLKSYLFTGKLNLESKDTLTLIAEYLFINIDDQLKQLHKKDENELKNLITTPNVKYRRPYDPIITEYPHLCSFMGSVNGNEFLNDTTGSRRFLPFEVLSINITDAQGLNMDLVWAQAYYLFKTNFRYWFNDEEVEEQNKRNSEFEMTSVEEELIQYYFSTTVPQGSLNQLKHYPPAIIQSKLEKYSNLRLSVKKLGEALNKLGYKKLQKTTSSARPWGYFLYEKNDAEISEQASEKIEQLTLN